MIADISPTRMELLRLKKRLMVAQRGHKLLKDKLDELIRRLLLLVRELAELRAKINEQYAGVTQNMGLARHFSFPEAVEAALMVPGRALSIRVDYVHVLNLNVPQYIVDMDERTRTWGFSQTSSALDHAMDIFDSMIQEVVVLAQKEKAVQMMAEEIRKTRRRVNALEYILIPDIEETIRYIKMKLDEQERNSQTQLMRIKDIVRAPRAQTSAYPGAVKYPV